MKCLSYMTAAILGAFALAGCEATQEAEPAPASMGVINEYCPGMPTHKVSATAPTVMYAGHEIGFCCEGCVSAWEEMSAADKAAFIEEATAGRGM